MRIEANSYSEGLMKLEQHKSQDTNRFQDILQEAKKNQDDAKLKEVCQELESVFIHQMISQMRSSIPSGGFMEANHGEEVFQDMLDQEYSKKMSKAGGMGLADMMYRQLSNKPINE